MDHLPPVPNAVYPPLTVPYRFSPEHPYRYDHKGWTSYPARVGWDKNTAYQAGAWTQGATGSTNEAASFLQAWLFFGLLGEFLSSEHYTESEFVRTNKNGVKVITTEKLPQCLVQWDERHRLLSAEEQRSYLHRMRNCLAEIGRFTNRFANSDYPLSFSWPLTDAEAFSIIALATTLQSALVMTDWKFKPLEGLPQVAFSDGNKVLNSRLQKCWCPNDVAWLKSNFNLLSIYHLTRLPHPPREVSHSICTIDECLAMNIDEDSYQTSHVQEGCPCDHMAVCLAEITSVLQAGNIPVVRVQYEDDFSRPHLQVLQSDSRRSVKYVAISHIWADGLGNPHDNSLPTCQILRIQRLVSSACGKSPTDITVPFWIDTLCVPLPKHDEDSSRKLAIGHMRDYYQAALTVLVLDRDLMSYQGRHVDATETILRIATSRWQRRLWTLQEGALASDLRFQFADDVVEIMELLELGPSEAFHPVFTQAVFHCWGIRFLNPLMSEEVAKTPAQKLANAVNAARWRSTSHSRDEIICVATLCGYDAQSVREILDCPEELRAQEFYHLQKEIPSDLIFVDTLRMAEKGYRWCPQSLLLRSAWKGNNGLYSIKTDQGLVGTFTSLLITPWTPLPGKRIELRTSIVCLHTELDDVFYFVSPLSNVLQVEAQGDCIWPRGVACPMLLLQQTPLSGLPMSGAQKCALVDVEGELDAEASSNRTIVVRWHAALEFSVAPSSEVAHWQQQQKIREVLDSPLHVRMTRCRSLRQRIFCIT